MSELLQKIRGHQLEARKARNTIATGVLTAVIGEAGKITAEDHKKGLTEVTDERVLKTLKSFVGNIDLSLNGEPGKSSPVANEEARAKLQAERVVLMAYIPQELDETALRAEVALIAAKTGTPLSIKDTKTVKTTLEEKFPGQINARLLSDVLKSQPA